MSDMVGPRAVAKHGFYWFYNQGCRCDACREAWRTYKAEYRRRTYDERHPNSGRKREPQS